MNGSRLQLETRGCLFLFTEHSFENAISWNTPFMTPFGIVELVSVHLPGFYMYSVWFCVVVLSANTTKVLVWLGCGGLLQNR